MAGDLTAVLVPQAQLDAERVWSMLRERGGNVLVRVAPLDAVELVQVEVHDAKHGLPAEDPELVAQLSRGGKAVFVHVNHAAKQAMVHGFVDGVAQQGWAGEPDAELVRRLRHEAGADLDAIVAADDGSRIGIGIAASHTVALASGRVLAIPRGTPTGFNSFAFHDRGHALGDGEERLAFFAFDRARAFAEPAEAWATRLAMAPAGAVGPLEGARAEAQAELAALGRKSPAEAQLSSPRALEVVAFAAALAWAGGDEASYWDERVLPLFSICSSDVPPTPTIDAQEAEELDGCESLLHAMVETLPYAAPRDGESTLLTQLSPREILPLTPWSEAQEVTGSIFIVKPTRLSSLVRAFDGTKLNAALTSFSRAWYRAARPGQPEGDAFANWRQVKEEEGKADFERFVAAWAELRALVEIVDANRLDVGLLFYA
jgi:hypothetical protein